MAPNWHNRFLAAAVLLGLCSTVAAKLVPFTLSEMVASSDCIVRGTVTDVEQVRPQPGAGARQTVAIEVTQVLKGDLGKQILLTAYPELIETAVFRKNEEVLLFLQRRESGYVVVQGFLGKITLANDMAGPMYLANQPDRLPVMELVRRIHTILKSAIR